MIAEVDGPVEMTRSRRRGSTIGSTGLDYSSCHRVDEDIICRIRSLLLSRNDHRPPRTPCPSDEHNHLCLDLGDTVAGFDFSTAKSVAKIARQDTGRLSTPDIGKVSAASLDMESRKTSRPSLPSIKLALPRLRKSSSASDLRVQVDIDDIVQSPTTLDCNPGLSGDTKYRFKLPKLVLQDKRKVSRKVKSCIEINPPIPDDDLKIHETELLCCPPCDPNDLPKSKYTTNIPRWPGGTIRAVPGDLACFLAGCPPSHLECKKHHRRQGQDPKNSIMDRRIAEDSRGVAEGLSQDIARLSHSLIEVKVWSKDEPDEPKAPKLNVERRAGDFGSDGLKGPTPSISVKPPTSTSGEVSEPEICSSQTSTSDAFPHAFQSMELVADESVPHRLSTTVSTNFSLPGYKARRGSQVVPQPSKQEARQPSPTIKTSPARSVTFSPSPLERSPTDISPKNSMPAKEVEITKSSDSKPTSLFSGGSRRSASARHALLKPSVTETQPVDTGLPIPPVLSPISSVSETPMREMPAYYRISGVAITDFVKGQNQANVAQSSNGPNSRPEAGTGPEVSKPWDIALGNVQATTASPVVAHVTTVQTAEDLLQSVQSRVEGRRIEAFPPARPQSPPPAIFMPKAAVGAPRIVAEPSRSPSPAKNPISASEAIATVSESDSLNAAYWGFVPQVKEAVQCAVRDAVRNAVRETTVPPGLEKNKASNAYRRVVASSLVEAARTADDYLCRASLWNEPPSSARGGSESTVIRPPGEETESSAPAIGDPPCHKVRQASVVSKENVETYGSQQPNLALSVNEMDSVLLEKVDKQKPKKKRPRPFRNGPRLGYDAIPTRDSSKNRVLSTKTSATNMSSNIPRKRSYDRLVTRVQLRSISSEASLKQERAGEKPLLSSKDPDRRNNATSASVEEIDGRQNTVTWLKGLLSNNGSYEPRFTALPPRTVRGPSRSQTAPVKPAAELYLEFSGDPTKVDQQFSKGQVPRAKRDDRSENFTRTINDLENLVNEAMVIARQAADNKDAEFAPAVLGSAAKVLKTERNRYQAKLSGIRDSDEAASIHDSLRSFSDSEMSYQSDDPELYTNATNAPAKGLIMSIQKPARNPAGWPPTGRTSTPYPPASMPPSNDSRSPPIDTDYLTMADPRSFPTETEFQGPRKPSKPADPADTIDDDDDYDEGVPEFRNPEPFSNPLSRENTRKSSARSPKRLSPTRQTQAGPQPGIGEFQDIPLPKITPRNTAPLQRCVQDAHSEEEHQAVKNKLASKSVPTKQEVREYIVANREVPIQPRTSSQNLGQQAEQAQGRDLLSSTTSRTGNTYDWQDVEMENMPLVQEGNDTEPAQMQVPRLPEQPYCGHSFDGSQATEEIDFNVGFGVRQRGGGEPSRSGRGVELQDNPDPDLPQTSKFRKHPAFSLRGKNHVSLNEHHKGFSLTRSNKRQSIARDWSPGRKRFVASVACFSTALIGIIVGIYAGETPAIQYYIVDFHHYTVLGNVFFFIGLSIPTFFFWPLPLLHGRKPYILGSMSLAMPLLFPQALAVGSFRSPYVSTYRVGLILSRAIMGFALGFANMNFKGMLTDLFGASLQSANPHQEHVDEFDVRRHGGGMGVWLGLWTWSALGSIGLGFLIGAVIINHLPPAWGFYVSICIIAFVMLLNVLCPEVRRSAFRRSVAEVVNGQDVSRRLARGEVKMHMVQSGPKWWGEEFQYGVMLSLKMLRQPGFMVMAAYVAWIYGQMVLNILVCVHLWGWNCANSSQLLAALMSKNYKFTSPRVGASVMAIPISAFCSIPFQKAGLFSRSRQSGPPNNDQTFQKKMSWTSHMVRRAIFILVLPFAGMGYTLSASGPPIPFIIPILFAGLIGFLSNLAMAECHGIIMETFDTSDLQPGMTGRPRGSSGDKTASKRTNYSSFPRVCSAFGITQGLGYLIAAAASGVGGVLSRHLGQQAACGVMAGVLLILSLLLLGTLIRFTEVQIIPDSKKEEMNRYHNARRASQLRAQTGLEEDEPWRPVIIGNPHHHTRRMCLLELGSMSRFSEIRKKNRLVDEKSLEAKHPNRAALEALEVKIKEKEVEVVAHIRRSLSRASSRGSRRSKLDAVPEQGDLGGHREMLDSRGGSGKGSGRGRNLSRVQDVG